MGAQTTQSSGKGSGGGNVNMPIPALQGLQGLNNSNTAQGQPGQGAMPPGSPSGKGAPAQPPQMMQPTPPGNAQNTITSGQPIMGQPNQYMNTVGANTQPLFNNQAYQPPVYQNNGKGKG